MRNMKSTILDYKEIVNSYVNITDWRVKENSTVTYSVGGLILSNPAQSRLITGCLRFTMRRLPVRIAMRTFTSMTFHAHRLLRRLSLEAADSGGLGGVLGKIISSPARHLSTLCNQMVNFFGHHAE